MHIFSKNLGDTVRRAREESRMSQTELAEKLNLDVRTIINIENYRGNPKLEVLFPLIRELKILPEQIFFPENQCTDEIKERALLELCDCSELELKALIPVIHSVKEAIRSNEAKVQK